MIRLLSLFFALLVAPFESKGRVEAKNSARRHQLIVLRRNVWARFGTNCIFWLAFILARPLGATVGDFLDKPISQGSLHLSRPLASAVIAVFIVACVLLLPQRAGTHPGETQSV